MNKSILITSLVLFCCQIGLSQQDTITFGLKGKIIRALEQSANSSSTFYVGLKGNNMGAGLVYKSEDAGESWHVLNNGLPIDPYVADIQAVAETNLQNRTLFAGTWKNGLFKSEDAGMSWTKDFNFPSSDIRSIRAGVQNPKLIYAATSNFGVVKSLDGGLTWKRNTPAQIDSTFQFAWSIEIDPNDDSIIYALTFGNGVWKSSDQGEHWGQVLDTEGKVVWDMKISDVSEKIWVASSKRGDSLSTVYLSEDKGLSWEELSEVPQIGVNQVNVLEDDNKQILLLGSWQDGVYKLEHDSWTKVDGVDFSTIAHILVNNDKFLIGSWGNGIYHFEP